MSRKSRILGCAALLGAAAVSTAHDGNAERYAARLSSYNETPAISSVGEGHFSAVIDEASQSISFELSYSNLESAVTQSHVHFGSPFLNGGISFFLCSNLGNGPAGTQACPAQPGQVTGIITAAAVVGPGGQGITAGQFDEIVRAIRAGVAYANVHTTGFPGGEIRGQLKRVRGHDGNSDSRP